MLFSILALRLADGRSMRRHEWGVAGRVFAIDILPIAPIKGVVIVQGDLATESLSRELELRLKNEPIGLVLSDMAPNLTGIKAAD